MNNNSKPICDFSAEIVSYIYNETGAADRSKFEEHLPGCVYCTEELAGLSEARFAVYEWQKADFAHLSTPMISLPSQNNESTGLLAGLRLLFPRPLLAGSAAFSAAIVLIGLTLLFTDRQTIDNADLAQTNKSDARSSPPVLGGVDAASADGVVTDGVVADGVVLSETRKNPVHNPKPSKPKPPPTREANKNQPKDTRVAAPTLTNFEDVEDTTLRLTDLLEEIDTKE